MRLLLDSHVIVWWLDDDDALTPDARSQIAATDNDIFFSAASVWELAIKRASGKLDLNDPEFPDSLVRLDHFSSLPVNDLHAVRAAALPKHHGDPFDRMLIAQAVSEGLTIVTHDRKFAAYDVPVLWT